METFIKVLEELLSGFKKLNAFNPDKFATKEQGEKADSAVQPNTAPKLSAKNFTDLPKQDVTIPEIIIQSETFEEGAGLNTTTNGGFQWGVGNGDMLPQDAGVTSYLNGHIKRISLHSYSGDVSVELYVDGTPTGHIISASGINATEVLKINYPISEKDLINFRTISGTRNNEGGQVGFYSCGFIEPVKVCETIEGYSDEVGFKKWCWENTPVASGAPNDKEFANGTLRIGNECNPNQVTNDGKRLRFYVNPTAPSPQSWCNNEFNMRAEVATNPWEIRQPIGTEEWFKFDYTFGNTYKADAINNYVFMQNILGGQGTYGPIVTMMISQGNAVFSTGEVLIVNASQATGSNSYTGTGIFPKAGDTLEVKGHLIYGDDSNGLWEVWINGELVHSKQSRTVRAVDPFGGNLKFGIYKHGWRNASNVQASIDQGINDLEVFMGDLSIVTRNPEDTNYGTNPF